MMDSMRQTGTESSASISAAWIPHEIIIEILLRLPVKTLLRFRCVCKSWKSLISNADFIGKHLVHMSLTEYPLHRHLLFGNRRKTRLEDVSIDSISGLKEYPFGNSRTTRLVAISLDSVLGLKEYEFTANPPRSILQLDLDEALSGDLWPVGSCNGLILLVNYDSGILLLWNPSIREAKILPGGEPHTHCKIHNIYSFGYDSISNDYKVIEVSKRRVSLYSLRANSWRRIADSPYTLLRSFLCYGNAFIWMISFLSHTNREIFVSFDLVEESFEEHPLPVYGRYCMLGEYHGDVCAMYKYDSYIDVWVMKEFGVKESWVKILTFLAPAVGPSRPLCMLGNGAIVLGESSVTVYNKKNYTYKTIGLEDSHIYPAQIYVESLVSPNGE